MEYNINGKKVNVIWLLVIAFIMATVIIATLANFIAYPLIKYGEWYGFLGGILGGSIGGISTMIAVYFSISDSKSNQRKSVILEFLKEQPILKSSEEYNQDYKKIQFKFRNIGKSIAHDIKFHIGNFIIMPEDECINTNDEVLLNINVEQLISPLDDKETILDYLSKGESISIYTEYRDMLLNRYKQAFLINIDKDSRRFCCKSNGIPELIEVNKEIIEKVIK